MQENILKMARLIRQRPSISARDVAKSLGYAEPKSVYYWLGKIGFSFRTFKEAVLSGVWPGSDGGMAEPLRSYDSAVPVAEAFNPDGTPVRGDGTPPFTWPGALFAYLWRREGYLPHICPGDWVVVANENGSRRATVLLLDEEGTPAVARVIDDADRPLLVEISFGRVWTPPFPTVIGRIAAIVRRA